MRRRPPLDFPKGRRHSSGETDVNCALREFEEESGVAGSDYQLLPGVKRKMAYVHMGVRYINVFYAAVTRRFLSPAVDLRRLDQAAEVAELRWLDIEAIRQVDPHGRLEATAGPIFRHVKRLARGGCRPRPPLAFRLSPYSEARGTFHDAADYLRVFWQPAPAGRKAAAEAAETPPRPPAGFRPGAGKGGGGARRAAGGKGLAGRPQPAASSSVSPMGRGKG